MGPYFGYGGPELDEWIQAELDEPQVVVLGRVTYEVLSTISSNGSDRVSQRLTALPKVVVSSTLSQPAGVGDHSPHRRRCDRGAACGQGRQRRADANKGQLVRNLVAAGLVDRPRLMVFPLTCGAPGATTSSGRERWSASNSSRPGSSTGESCRSNTRRSSRTAVTPCRHGLVAPSGSSPAASPRALPHHSTTHRSITR